MKELLKKISQNSTQDPHSSLLGAAAGLPDLIQGIATHDCVTILKGISIIFLGLIIKSN